MIIDNNDGIMRYQIKTHHNTICCIDLKDKKLRHFKKQNSNMVLIANDSEKVMLFLPAENLYICGVSEDGTAELSREAYLFDIVKKNKKIAIKIDNKYLSADWDGSVSLKKHCLEWELFSFYRDDLNDCLKNSLVNVLREQEVQMNAIKTCFSTRVFINLDGFLVHGNLVINDSLYAVYSLVYTFYAMLYIKKGTTILYIKDIDENGKALLSIYPHIFAYEQNSDKTVSFHKDYLYLSATNIGTFCLKNKDNSCDFHLEVTSNQSKEFSDAFNFQDTEKDLSLKNKVLSVTDTLKCIIDRKMSVARFGDGEMRWMLMRGGSIKNYQKHDIRLAKMLIETLRLKSDKLLLCINNMHHAPGNNHWKEIYKFRNEFFRILPQGYTFGDACVSRAINSSTLNLWKQIFQDRNICIIEGEYSRLGIGNDLFSNVASVERILAPTIDAFDKFDEILDFVSSKIEKDKLILLALGPTATVLAAVLSNLGYQAIDIGHIDVCYEWHLRGGKTKVKGKYVYEAGGMDDDSFPSEEEKKKYLSQIIKKICE